MLDFYCYKPACTINEGRLYHIVREFVDQGYTKIHHSYTFDWD